MYQLSLSILNLGTCSSSFQEVVVSGEYSNWTASVTSLTRTDFPAQNIKRQHCSILFSLPITIRSLSSHSPNPKTTSKQKHLWSCWDQPAVIFLTGWLPAAMDCLTAYCPTTGLWQALSLTSCLLKANVLPHITAAGLLSSTAIFSLSTHLPTPSFSF